MDTNKFYQLAFSSDFSCADTQEALDNHFQSVIDKLVAKTESCLESTQSISEVVETFHFSVLAAALLQRKASLREKEIRAVTPPEETVYTAVLSQLGCSPVVNPKMDDVAELFDSLPSAHIIKGGSVVGSLAQIMSEDFKFIGRTLRAFAVTCLLGDNFTHSNSTSCLGSTLSQYEPTALLTNLSRFSVIGTVEKNPHFHNRTSSVKPIDTSYYIIEVARSLGFAKIFSNKLAELLQLDSMSNIDRARLEEIRHYMLDKLTRGFFGLNDLHLMRVCSLVLSMSSASEYMDASNDTQSNKSEADVANPHESNKIGIGEALLRELTPNECISLLARQSIVTKTGIDTAFGSFYKPNAGIGGFYRMVKRYSLLDGHRLGLLRSAVESIESK